MSRKCTICQHPKRDTIDRLRESAGVVAQRYNLSPDAVQRHRKHLDSRNNAEVVSDDSRNNAEAQAPIVTTRHVSGHLQHVVSFPEFDVSVEPETPMAVLKQGLPYLRRAMELAGEDRLEQQRLVATLNEMLMSEDMGL